MMNAPRDPMFSRTWFAHQEDRSRRLTCQTDLIDYPLETEQGTGQPVDGIALAHALAQGDQSLRERCAGDGGLLRQRANFPHDTEQPLGVAKRQKIDVPPAGRAFPSGKQAPRSSRLAFHDLGRGTAQASDDHVPGILRSWATAQASQASGLGAGQTGQVLPGAVDEKNAAAAIENKHRVLGPLKKGLPTEVVQINCGLIGVGEPGIHGR